MTRRGMESPLGLNCRAIRSKGWLWPKDPGDYQLPVSGYPRNTIEKYHTIPAKCQLI